MPKSWKRKEKQALSAPAAEEQVPASALRAMEPSQSVRLAIQIKNWDASFMQTTPMMSARDVN